MNKKLSLTEQEALECYNSSDATKAFLENNFPFLKGDIKSICTNLDELFSLAGETEEMFNKRTVYHSSQAKGIELGEVLAKILNKGADHMKCFYYPWFEKIADSSGPSGFALSYYGCGSSSAVTHVGSRQKFIDLETMKHAVKYFPQVFEQVLIS